MGSNAGAAQGSYKMQFVSDEHVLKHNVLNHHINEAKRTVKLTGIWKCAAKGDSKGISKCLSGKESPNVENEEKRTALHYAAEFGHIDAASTLLSAGAAVNARDMRGDTPMHCALRNKQEDMALFLMGRGCDLDTPNSASITCWELAEKISKRFVIKMKENTKCSTGSSAPAPKPKAAPAQTTGVSTLLDQAFLLCGQYFMYLRALPQPGSPPTDPFPAPFPATPHDALRITHGRWQESMSELVLTANKDQSSAPNFRGSAQSMKDHVSRQVEFTKTPITDMMIFNSLNSDLFSIANSAIDMLAQYEESVISRAFSTHVEKFTLSLKKATEVLPPGPGGVTPKWDSSEFVSDYVKLNRNVLTQMLYVSDPEKSKKISDGLLQLAGSVRALLQTKATASSFRAPDPTAHVQAIAGNLRHINSLMGGSRAQSALFPEEEQEVFDTATRLFEEILALPVPLSFGAKRCVQIMLSEVSYIKEAAFASPPDRDVLLNCALFVHCTSTRIARMAVEKKKEPAKTVAENIAGLLSLCGNMSLLVACALVTRNKSYQFVHVGYAARAVACATMALVDPVFGVTTY